MKSINERFLTLRIWKDNRGQDLIEYALMAGFIAVAAGALMPGITAGLTGVFVKVGSVLTSASS